MSAALPLSEIDEVVDVSGDDFAALRGASLLLTGGTGFVGRWLTSCLLRADDRLALGLRVALLTRRPERLPPWVAEHRAIVVVAGDVRALPPVGRPDFVMHGAASSSAKFGVGDGEPRAMAATIVEGTQAVLAAAGGARTLFLSSGAVYASAVEPVAEDASTAPASRPDPPESSYAQAKRHAEALCAAATEAGDAAVVIARLFTFVGPGLPLDAHFAAGNFLGDVLAGRPLVVRGDGAATRSYLYAADLVSWLCALLVRGAPGRAYNVGSPEPVTIRELADVAARLVAPPLPVRVSGTPSPGGRAHVYVPVVGRAVGELGVGVRTPLREALRRTLDWHRAIRPPSQP